MIGGMSRWLTRMRFDVPVSVPIGLPLTSRKTEFLDRLYSWRFSREGRSWATAIIIPKTVETQASMPRPATIRARRSLYPRGRVSGGPPLPPPNSAGSASGGTGRSGSVPAPGGVGSSLIARSADVVRSRVYANEEEPSARGLLLGED